MYRLAASNAANYDIHTDISVYNWTADKERNVFFRVWIGTTAAHLCAGGGAYSVYLTVQPAAANSYTYAMEPKTSITAGATEYSMGCVTIPFPVYTGDVINVRALGVTGDTSVGVVVERYDDSLPNVAPQTAGGIVCGSSAYQLAIDSAGKVAVPDTQKVDVNTIKTQGVTAGAAVTVLASVGTAATSTAQTGDSYALIGTPTSTGPASIAHDIANISSAIVTGTPSNVFATAGALTRGTALQTDLTAIGTPSTYAATATNDAAWFASKPTTAATVNGIALTGLWQQCTFLCGASKATSVTVIGSFRAASARFSNVYAYNYVTTFWDLISSSVNRLNTNAADLTYGPYYLLPAHQKNIVAGDGEVIIAFVSPSVTITDILAINQMFVAASLAAPTAAEIANAVKQNSLLMYYPSGVWLDSVNGTAGTVVGTNGTLTTPVTTLADAVTINASLNQTLYNNKANRTLTLDRTMDYCSLDGPGGWYLALGGQSINGTVIRNSEGITGVATSSTKECFLYDCQLGTSSWGEADFHRCHIISATITLTQDISYLFDNCVWVPTSGASPILDFGTHTTGARYVVMGNNTGMVTIKTMKINDILMLDGDMDVTLDATCTAGTVYLSGNIRLTNSGSGQTIHQEGRMATDQTVGVNWANVINKTTTNALTNTTISGVTVSGDVTLAASQPNYAPARIADLGMINAGTVVSSSSTTLVQLAVTASATPMYYNGMTLRIKTGAGAGQSRTIISYGGGTNVCTLDRALVTQPTNASTYEVWTSDSPTLNAALQVATSNATASVAINSGTVVDTTGSPVNKITLASSASASASIYNNNIIAITGGTGVGQSRTIVAYTGTASLPNRCATISPAWVVTPVAGSTYAVYAAVSPSLFSDQGVSQGITPATTDTIILAATASATNSYYNGSLVVIVSGTGSGQANEILSYVGSTRTATMVDNWAVAPFTDSVYEVLPVNASVPTGGTSTLSMQDVRDAMAMPSTASVQSGSVDYAIGAAAMAVPGSTGGLADYSTLVAMMRSSGLLTHITVGGNATVNVGGSQVSIGSRFTVSDANYGKYPSYGNGVAGLLSGSKLYLWYTPAFKRWYITPVVGTVPADDWYYQCTQVDELPFGNPSGWIAEGSTTGSFTSFDAITGTGAVALTANQHVIVDSGTVTTTTNLTNAPANGDLTAAMKQSVRDAMTLDSNATVVEGSIDYAVGAANATAPGMSTGLATTPKAGWSDSVTFSGNATINSVSIGTTYTLDGFRTGYPIYTNGTFHLWYWQATKLWLITPTVSVLPAHYWQYQATRDELPFGFVVPLSGDYLWTGFGTTGGYITGLEAIDNIGPQYSAF